MDTDEDYFRRYLDDPINAPTPSVSNSDNVTPTPDENYFRRYLNDPNA